MTDVPFMAARIVPGDAEAVAATGLAVAVSGEVRREALKDAPGAALVFGQGGRITWQSADLLQRPGGSILLHFNYSTATEYAKDCPVLAVTDARGRDVLRVTLGRVLFKVARPPHEFAVDLYLNEAEGRWMRTVITWERLEPDRMLLRATVNDRVYDHAVVPAFPQGVLNFLVGPERVNVREVAFYDRPLPRAAFPHRCRPQEATPDAGADCPLGFISVAEQAAINERGGVVVLLPDGARSQGLPSGLRTMGLLDFRAVNDGGLKAALRKAAVLILPDNDFWSPDRNRDQAIEAYVRSGGGLLALGRSALEVRRLRLLAFEPREAGCEGAVFMQLRDDAAPWKSDATNRLFKNQASVDLFMRRGPFYEVSSAMTNAVAAVEPCTGLPCVLASAVDKGRVVLAAAAPFGYYFWNPTFETVAGRTGNALRYLFFKALVFHAAGGSWPATAEGRRWQTPGRVPASRNLGDTRETTVAVEKMKPGAGVRRENLRLGRTGSLGFWFKADTVNFPDPEPRNLVWLSDGGENTLQLYFDPADQFLVLKSTTPNGEEILYANERTTWDARAWRHVGFTWEATESGDAAVELYIDGLPAASGGVSLPSAAWNRLVAGGAPGMKGLEMEAKEWCIGPAARLDLDAIRKHAAPPISWEDTPEDRARMERFLRERRVAILGDTHPNHWKSFRTCDQYGITCDVLMQKDLEAGSLEKGNYAVLFAPGGGPPAYADPQAMRDRIRNYVRAGHGYVGICAGMMEAASGASPAATLCLYKTPLGNFAGTQLIDVQLRGDHPVLAGVPAAFRDGSGAPAVRFVHMAGPPLKVKDRNSDASPVAWLGLSPDLAAGISFAYGSGRGVVWSPHPELDAWGWWRPSDRTRYIMRALMRHSLYYAASLPP